MPDIRIEIPTNLKAQMADELDVGQSIVAKTLADIAAVSAQGAVGTTLNLTVEDFWVRVGEVYSNAPVVYVDITMLSGENRTKEVRKKLANAIGSTLEQSLNRGTKKWVNVLVWVDTKDKDADYAEFGPASE